MLSPEETGADRLPQRIICPPSLRRLTNQTISIERRIGWWVNPHDLLRARVTYILNGVSAIGNPLWTGPMATLTTNQTLESYGAIDGRPHWFD